MMSPDHEVLAAAADWLDAGRPTALITVARTYGSSPRPVGSLMAVNAGGDWLGSVSGGCVETHLLAQLRASWPAQARLTTFGVTRDEAQRVGLPCGGRIELLVEPLHSAAPLRAVLAAMRQRRLLARRVCLNTGEVSLHAATREQVFSCDERTLEKVFGPQWRLLLIGAGHLARDVVAMARALDYEVIVCEPRAEHARQWQTPGAELDARMPDDAVKALARDARSAVLALTHDPKLDDLALMEALESEAFYVGALGSVANNAKRRERLAWLGVRADAIARLHGPIGLPIGSKTPAEIAVAILAELTAVRRGITLTVSAPHAAETHPPRACGS
jgi:xanthine dehydrogenase accessory factor